VVNDKTWKGKESPPVEILSSLGPSRPTLSFTTETAALVTLSWTKPSDLNSNTKILQWEIYRGLFKDDLKTLAKVTNLDESSAELTTIPTYKDVTSALRDGQIYYKIRA